MHAFPLEARKRARAASANETLTFGLDGLERRAALAGTKLAWMTVSGPDEAVVDALARLSTVLPGSVSTHAQIALGALLASSGVTRDAIAERCAENLAALRELAGVEIPPVEGGWQACLRFPGRASPSEALAERGVHVHPGRRYDFPSDASIVVGLLTPPETMRRALPILRAITEDD